MYSTQSDKGGAVLTDALDLAGALLLIVAAAVAVWPWSVALALALAGVLVLALSYLIDRKRGRS